MIGRHFFLAAYGSGQVTCLALLKDWCERKGFDVPIAELEAESAENNYRGVAAWVDALR